MRTNIDIDDQLMAQAMAAGGFKTKREAVEEGLRLLARRKVYDGLLSLRGKLQWDDSDASWAASRAARSVQASEPTPKAYGARKTAQARKPKTTRTAKGRSA